MKTLDPNSAHDYGAGIRAPGTSMKARAQSESLFRKLLVPMVILAIFGAVFIKPIIGQITGAAHSASAPIPRPTFDANAPPTPNPDPIGQELSEQQRDVSPKIAFRSSALQKIGVKTSVAPQPAATASVADAARTAAKQAADLQRVYGDLNGSGNSDSGFGTFGYTGQQITPPVATAAPTPAPVVQVQSPSNGIAFESAQTPVPALTPAAQPTPESQTHPVQNPYAAGNPYTYSGGGVYIPGPSGIDYVGATGGQQAGYTPETAQQVHIASQAAFLSSDSEKLYSSAHAAPPVSYNVVFPTHPIHWRVDSTIVSTLPGRFFGHITQDVYSDLPVPCGKNICPHELLIPATTVVEGVSNADVQPGDTRLQGHLIALIYPNGWTLRLTDAQAGDAGGANGLPADVDNHVGRVNTVTFLGSLMSGFGTAVALHSLAAPVGLGSLVLGGFGNKLAENASQATQMKIQQSPTLTVHAGYEATFTFAQIQPLQPYSKMAGATHE